MKNKLTGFQFKIILFLLCFFCNCNLFSQSMELPPVVEKITAINERESFMDFKENSNLTIDSFEQNQSVILGLSQYDSWQLIRTDSSIGFNDYKFKHYRYQQNYKGIELEGAQIIVTEKNGALTRLDGFWVKNLNVNVIPSLSEDAARNFALAAVNADKYMWEDSLSESYLKVLRNDTNATYYPKGKLLLFLADYHNPQSFILAYRFEIRAETPGSAEALYIDANLGSILRRFSLLKDADGYARPSVKD